VVVNTPARSGAGVKLYGTLLTESMQELGRKLVTLWADNAELSIRDPFDVWRSLKANQREWAAV
jgi:hypothetical protein